jgi:hypothetical protein
MSTAIITRPTLREVVTDALDDAYWYRRGLIEGCADCPKHPAGICADHQADSALARDYEDARKQIQRTPGDPEVVAVFGEMAALVSGEDRGTR